MLLGELEGRHLLHFGSYLLIVVVLVLTGMGLPVPEEVPIVAAGIAASHGQLDPWLALACCIIGALGGDCLLYAIGHKFGRSVLVRRPWWGRFFKPERQANIETMIQRHGLKVFFLARFLVGLRAPIYLSAGILKVPFRRFLAIDLFCSSMVIATFFFLSFRYGKTIVAWIQDMEILLTVGVVLAIAAIAFYFWRRHRRKAALSCDPPANNLSKNRDRHPGTTDSAG
jgi:membrane protein DedA with SNARE-associated domain